MDDRKVEIFICGKELFSSNGFKDTNVSDITKMIGIGVGTFYKYYSSKEELFLEIYLKENEKLKTSIMESVELDEDPIKTVRYIIAKNLDGMKSNPILREWYNKELFSKLEKEFYKLGGIESIDKLMGSGMLDAIRFWKSKGKIRDDISDDMILTIFNAIPYIDIHKEELGVEYFPHILEYLEEFIMIGLTDCQKK